MLSSTALTFIPFQCNKNILVFMVGLQASHIEPSRTYWTDADFWLLFSTTCGDGQACRLALATIHAKLINLIAAVIDKVTFITPIASLLKPSHTWLKLMWLSYSKAYCLCMNYFWDAMLANLCFTVQTNQKIKCVTRRRHMHV